MTTEVRAWSAVRDMERMNPHVYEGIYGSFLRSFMSTNKSNWCRTVSDFIKSNNGQLTDVADEMGLVMWDQFVRKISC